MYQLLSFLQVFAIGIGSGVDKAELGRIASDGQHVFQVTNFDALNTLQAELKKTACKSEFQIDKIRKVKQMWPKHC